MRLKGKSSLVTGASRGIGKAIALALAKEGSDVVVNYVKDNSSALETVNEILRIGRKAFPVKADVANKSDVFKMVAKAIEEFGKIDILVNNAGILLGAAGVLEESDDEWEKVMKVNLFGTFHCLQAVVPHMIGRTYGKIVNMSSIAGIPNARKGAIAYAISKAAVINLTKKLAYELGPYNINVNAIAPGIVRTDLMDFLVKNEEELKKLFEDRVAITSLRRIGEPEDIANVALFLASDESSFVTGQVIVADGGRIDYFSHSS